MEHAHTMPHVEHHEASPQTYKPLVLVAIFIVGITALIELNAGKFSSVRAMNSFMAGFFIFFSFFKFLNLQGFADAFTTYDVIAKRFRAYSFAYPFIELSLGIAFALGQLTVAADILTIMILTIGNYGVWQVLRQKKQIQCACLGTIFNLPMTKITLFENSLMTIMALMSLVVH